MRDREGISVAPNAVVAPFQFLPATFQRVQASEFLGGLPRLERTLAPCSRWPAQTCPGLVPTSCTRKSRHCCTPAAPPWEGSPGHRAPPAPPHPGSRHRVSPPVAL